jgi:hypothetical protein
MWWVTRTSGLVKARDGSHDGARPFLGTGRVSNTGMPTPLTRCFIGLLMSAVAPRPCPVHSRDWLGIDVHDGFDLRRLTVHDTSLNFGAADTWRFILAIVEGGSRDRDPSICGAFKTRNGVKLSESLSQDSYKQTNYALIDL